jgi:phage-related tail fiber protein
MTQNTVNTGIVSNDGTGDTLRTAFRKINEDFTEVFSNVANNTSNIANLVVTVDTATGELLALTSISFDTANQAFGFANAQYTAMNAAFTMANTVNSLFYGAVVNAAAAYDFANSQIIKVNANYTVTNAAYTTGNAAFAWANSVNVYTKTVFDRANALFDYANSIFVTAGEAFDAANAGIAWALSGIANAESAYNFANGVSANTTSAYRVANSNYNVTNTAYGAANASFFKINVGYAVANAAYGCANTKVNTVNGVITGIFTVQGDADIRTGKLSVRGPSNTIELIDGVIYINGIPFDPTPAGTIVYFAGLSAPQGYLKANGQAVPRASYPLLFNAIGTTYGVGNGSTTFNIPDLRGEFIRGWDDGRGLDAGRGLATVQNSDVGSHTHTYNDLYGMIDDNPSGMQSIYDIDGNRVEYWLDDTGNWGGDYLPMNNDEDGDRSALYYKGRTDPASGNDTRPRNFSLLACIKY